MKIFAAILVVVSIIVAEASPSSLHSYQQKQGELDSKWIKSMLEKPRVTHDSHGKRIFYMDGKEDFFWGWVFDEEKFSSAELSHEECKLKTLSFSTVSMTQADCEDLKCPRLEELENRICDKGERIERETMLNICC
ncbi:hypothetical protein L3Y34_016358 [Caenorhabditis briggsae]|uniref:Uncharacterized protein n=1 Tax=Caenorhabditis briggsae TaxID=6238 RepID=A0AAE9J078_CAEBR|nr:hypothetical protein L3Y34_016358 [Caenorhabditis briggsae]